MFFLFTNKSAWDIISYQNQKSKRFFKKIEKNIPKFAFFLFLPIFRLFLYALPMKDSILKYLKAYNLPTFLRGDLYDEQKKIFP